MIHTTTVACVFESGSQDCVLVRYGLKGGDASERSMLQLAVDFFIIKKRLTLKDPHFPHFWFKYVLI